VDVNAKLRSILNEGNLFMRLLSWDHWNWRPKKGNFIIRNITLGFHCNEKISILQTFFIITELCYSGPSFVLFQFSIYPSTTKLSGAVPIYMLHSITVRVWPLALQGDMQTQQKRRNDRKRQQQRTSGISYRASQPISAQLQVFFYHDTKICVTSMLLNATA
jgi:hypothetical protein